MAIVIIELFVEVCFYIDSNYNYVVIYLRVYIYFNIYGFGKQQTKGFEKLLC